MIEISRPGRHVNVSFLIADEGGRTITVHLPYGKTYIPVEIAPERVIVSRISELEGGDGAALVGAAMEQPLGSPKLSELAAGKNTCTVIVSDHTRPVPSKDILPHMLAQLRQGNPDLDITLLVATGCHRGTTMAELTAKLGEEIVSREKIVVHDAFDPEKNIRIGVLPSGAPLVLDKLAAQTDLLVAEGFIEPHFFAGFSGGRKSVLPGVCDKVTVYGNHCGRFIADGSARTGVLEGNPIHRDMEAAAEMAKLAYIVNVVIDEHKRTVAAFAGDFRQAHAAGVDFLRKYCQVPPIPGKIVITTNGGAPLDQNLYQCVKGLTAAEATATDGGTIILCAEMADGIGGEQFYRDMVDCDSPAALFEKFSATPQAETAADQWQTQILCRVLKDHRVIFVTRPGMKAYIEQMKMEYAPDLDAALNMAGAGTMTVIPDGVSVCIC